MIIAVNDKGENRFIPTWLIWWLTHGLNLLDYQISPAEVLDKNIMEGGSYFTCCGKRTEKPGIFAVELFVG